MASFDEIGNGSINFGEVIKDVAINSLSTLARGLIVEMLSANIGEFNLLNYDFMNIHMMRNAYEKSITLNVVGENAYTDGNSDLTATPAQYPSYTRGNNYMEFVTNTREASKNGVLTTRVSDKDGNVTDLYLDTDSNYIPNKVEFTGNVIDKNSILYKTKKLIRQNKLKTIVSQFHTEGVEYNGQIGSEFGESHGRNLLTKDAENGGGGYSINGYNNPYCRVWTHHYKYDKLYKTMRANAEELNTWGSFEWDETDKGHGKDNTKYGDGENYDYAWRGHHNQDRRKVNSVLDTKTGLVKITPQYRNGGKNNRHTKECMFSIENLAWKDYDPYSFERALSWEQRGPFGGRIMWFPPYGIEIQETSSAKWNTNEFIGRGEPVYTYVNSERSGNLSFMMITDHPSTIDYASWWDDNTMIKGIDNGDGNSENDYLRYFAGCANYDNDPGDSGSGTPGRTGGLIVKPTPLTDEYIQQNPPPLVKPEKIIPKPPKQVPVIDKHPETIEFFVFFPNNYSGVMDAPTKPDASVNAIAYLLGGCNSMKQDQVDIPFGLNSVGFNYENGATIGYEMKKGPITTDLVEELEEYIQGGKLGTKEYVPEAWKKWCYRIDHLQPYTVGDHNGTNTINQSILAINLKDTKTNKTNLDVSDNPRVQEMAENKNNLYSFAEVAAALYSEKMMNMPLLYSYLVDCGVNQDRVNKLIDIFASKDRKLESIKCTGIASSHGTTSRNVPLSNNRAKTVIDWLHTYSDWQNVENSAKPEDNKIKQVDKKDAKNVNGDSAKLYRCAHCVMKFSSGMNTTNEPKVEEEPETKDLVGFKWVKVEPQPDGSIWNYYQRDNTVMYFEQKAKSADNYEKPQEGDITITEEQVLQIFDTYSPKKVQIIKNSSEYRGLYNERGFYINTFDYNKQDTPDIVDFSYTESKSYSFTSYVYDNGRLYKPTINFYCDVTGKTKEEIWNEYGNNFKDISNSMIRYNEGNYILIKENNDDIFYKCLVNYNEKYPDFGFDVNDWDEVTTNNIGEAITAPYVYVNKLPINTQPNDIIYTNDNIFKLCTSVDELNYPYNDRNNWEQLDVEEFEDGQHLFIGEYVTHEDILYVCIDDTEYTQEFNLENWNPVQVYEFRSDGTYNQGDVIECGQFGYYKAKNDIITHHLTDDLSPAMPGLIKNSDNPMGYFDGDYPYAVGDYCRKDNKYYKSKVDFSTKTVQNIPFADALNDGSWARVSDDELNSYIYVWELASLVTKTASVLCLTLEETISRITGDAEYTFDEDDTYSCIWKYGDASTMQLNQIDESTNLISYVQQHNVSLSDDENNYLSALENDDRDLVNISDEDLKIFIGLHKVLDSIKYIRDDQGTRTVCAEPAKNEDEMCEKTTRRDESLTEGCEDSLWIDRGDGLLIQECNLNRSDVISRFDPSTGKGDWNKLRYDQEYHFYKQWIDEHPLMYEKLQEKIKYFNPAFHSMTPEGFNARCTFLQQCTRQGNTKTMSDLGGETANNLAFGRPPYCVLRLGDFYYQMIIIENVSFDFNVSEGIQWDLNTEGNGVQPMLCKVNISFKFIGGGDITGPVQRLQNAMSFNYYANASFYDNRADRVQYQPTNWATMGGAGNDQMDYEKSYAYVTQLYEEKEPNIVVPSE